MKKLIVLIITVVLASTNAETKIVKGQRALVVMHHKESVIDGAWELVWEQKSGFIGTSGKPSQLKLFANGHFSYIGKDATGKVNQAGAGTFEVNGNSYKETHLYNLEPNYIGATDWQELSMDGDTLVFKLFTKAVLASGEDITAKLGKTIEKRVRVQ